jgi:DNA-binding response OmpR family regulator
VLRDLLTGSGYTVAEAADGQAGVAKARSERPDLILMDIYVTKPYSPIQLLRIIRGFLGEQASYTLRLVSGSAFRPRRHSGRLLLWVMGRRN